MNITILTVGTRGDVQPYIALALGLQAAGYCVRLATGTNYESLVTRFGIEYAPIRADYAQLISTKAGQEMKSKNPLKLMKNMRGTIYPLIERMLNDSWAAAQDADALIVHPKSLAGPHIAEKLGIPLFNTGTVPSLTPTNAFPAPGTLPPGWGSWANRLSYKLLALAPAAFGGIIGKWRERIGLLKKSRLVDGLMLRGSTTPVLYCYSRHVLPPPADWPPHVQVTGYWFLNESDHTGWKPDVALQQFLNAGDAPVYIGFGSMATDDAARLSQIVTEGVARSGVRAVIASGIAGLTAQHGAENLHILREAPHDALFPLTRAVVHHGGAGTTAAALRAGKPSLIVSFLADQPFWGNLLYERGLGVKPIPEKRLTADNLAQALRELVQTQALHTNAALVGRHIRAEDGVGEAVRVIQYALDNAPASSAALQPA